MKLRNIFVLVSVLLFCLTGFVQADWSQWAGNGHYYTVVYTPEGINWENASNAAQAMGGYLATVHSTEENDFIFNLINDSKYWFIDGAGNGEGPWLGGLRNPADYGQWIWVTGEDWTYWNWSGGEPNNSGGGEDRLDYFGPGGGINSVWNDVGHDMSAHGYVVESTVPEPATMSLLALGGLGLIRSRRKA